MMRSELDLQLLTTDSVWGKQEINPELRKKISQAYGAYVQKRNDSVELLMKRELPADRAIKVIEDSFESAGNKALEQAFLEGVMTEDEWLKMKGMGFKVMDMAAILGAYFGNRDKVADDEIVVMSQPPCASCKHEQGEHFYTPDGGCMHKNCDCVGFKEVKK